MLLKPCYCSNLFNFPLLHHLTCLVLGGIRIWGTGQEFIGTPSCRLLPQCPHSLQPHHWAVPSHADSSLAKRTVANSTQSLAVEREQHSVVQVGLELITLVSQPPKWWHHQHESPATVLGVSSFSKHSLTHAPPSYFQRISLELSMEEFSNKLRVLLIYTQTQNSKRLIGLSSLFIFYQFFKKRCKWLANSRH